MWSNEMKSTKKELIFREAHARGNFAVEFV